MQIGVVIIFVPAGRIVHDVFPNLRQVRLVANHVFVIVALPEFLNTDIEDVIDLRCRLVFEIGDDCSQRRGAVFAPFIIRAGRPCPYGFGYIRAR